MHRFVVFESDEKEKFRFEVTSDTAWVTMVDEMIGTHSSQETLKKIITKSSDDVLVEDALSYYNGNLTYKFLDSRKEFFEKQGKDISCRLVEYCVVNHKKTFLKKFSESQNERLAKLAREVLACMR